MSGGVALFDYDNDGDLDVFAVQGSTLRPGASGNAHGSSARSRLYRNDHGPNRDGRLRFTDVTERSALAAAGYGMGAAAGDFDNDGWIDLYVTFLGSSRMFRNNGDGTFTDVTTRTRTDVPGWPTSATFFDYDRDGWLDLYAVSSFSQADAARWNAAGGLPQSRLYRNVRGRFEDVTAKTQTGLTLRGSGCVAADLDGNGTTDLLVTAGSYDPQRNAYDALLWNNGDGTFTEGARAAGIDTAGWHTGAAVADVNGDGRLDLVVNNIDALVTRPGSLKENLLGMSFLRRLRSYEFSKDYLTLRG